MSDTPTRASGEHLTKRGVMARKLERQEKIWDLRLAGVSFGKIAEEIGVSKTYALKLYRHALDERAERVHELADRYVAHQVAQYDKLILAHWSRRGDPTHAGVIMRAMADKAKVLGLNVVRIEHGGSIETTQESAQERASRLMGEAADDIARMTPEQVAAEAAALAVGR